MEVSAAVRHIYMSLGFKRLMKPVSYYWVGKQKVKQSLHDTGLDRAWGVSGG